MNDLLKKYSTPMAAWSAGIFPSRRRAYLRGEDRQPVRAKVKVSIDLSDFRLSY